MKFIFGFLLIIGVLVIVPAVDFAFAAGDEPGKYLDRRVVIWNGSVVSGTIIWQVWRFRESHPKATPTRYEGTDW
jgi:hypothetical protein